MRKALFILGQLNDADVEWLSETGVRRRHGAGEALLEQGEVNEHLFIVLEGHVSISVAGREVEILGGGELLGEMSMIDTRRSSATVRALDECYTLCVPHEELRRQVQRDLGFGMRFYRALATFLAQRLRNERTPDFTKEIGLLEDQEQDDELDVFVLDNLQVAGERFARLLKKMMSARAE